MEGLRESSSPFQKREKGPNKKKGDIEGKGGGDFELQSKERREKIKYQLGKENGELQ